MGKRILIINGHPDPSPDRFCAALAEAYAAGAEAGGHRVRMIKVGLLDFPMIRARAAFETAPPPAVIEAAQDDIRWAEHIVIVHPLWLGSAPALLKGFFEQTFRYGFAIPHPASKGGLQGLLKGRSAQLMVTMGMPAPVYRLAFGGFGVRALERGVLRLAGIGPIRHDYIGMVEGSADARMSWLNQATVLGLTAR